MLMLNVSDFTKHLHFNIVCSTVLQFLDTYNPEEMIYEMSFRFRPLLSQEGCEILVLVEMFRNGTKNTWSLQGDQRDTRTSPYDKILYKGLAKEILLVIFYPPLEEIETFETRDFQFNVECRNNIKV